MRLFIVAVTFLSILTISLSTVRAENAADNPADQAPAVTSEAAPAAPEAEAAPTAAELRKKGDLQRKKKNITAAMALYRQALEADPADTANARVAIMLGKHYSAKKEYAEALKFFSMVTGQNRDLPEFQILFAEAFQVNGMNDSAIALLEPMAEKPKTARNVFKILGDAYYKIDSTDKAIKMYGKYVALGGAKTDDIAYLLAFEQEKTAPAKAKLSYTANTKRFPKDYRNYVRLGLMNTQAKATLPTALTLLKKAALLTDSVPSLWIDIGKVYTSMGKKEDAITAYRTCLQHDENNLEAKIRIGTILLETGADTDALMYLEKAHAQAPDSPEPMIPLASAYLKTNKIKQAVGILRKIKTVQPKNLEARRQLIEIYKKTGHDQMALDEIKASLDIERDYELLIPYAKLLIKLGKPEEAAAPLEEIIGMMPDNIDALMTMAMLKRKLGNLDEAIEIYKEVNIYDNKYAPSLYARAEVHMEQNKVKWAEMFYQRALAADPNFGLAEVGLAKLALLYNKKNECYDHLNKAQVLAPDDSVVQKAIEEVRNRKSKGGAARQAVANSEDNGNPAGDEAAVKNNKSNKKRRKRHR